MHVTKAFVVKAFFVPNSPCPPEPLYERSSVSVVMPCFASNGVPYSPRQGELALYSKPCCSFVRSRHTLHCVKRNLPITSLLDFLDALADKAIDHPNNMCTTSRLGTKMPLCQFCNPLGASDAQL